MTNDLGSPLASLWAKNRSLIVGLLIFFFALSVRVAYLENTVVKHPISRDAKKYVTYASNIVHHGVYSQDSIQDPKPDSQVTPGYPFFLAAILRLSQDFEAFYVNVLSIQAIIGALTAVLTFMIGMYVLPFGLAALAGILTALSPHLIATAGYLLTETLFTFLLSLALWLLLAAARKEKWVLYLGASLTIGFASLVRPALLLFPVFVSLIVIFYLKPPKRLLTALTLLIVVIAMWLPWSFWAKGHKSTEKHKASLAVSALVFGSYPGMVYKDPALKGFPYKDDPLYYSMCGDLRFALKTIAHRASEKPIDYAVWYLFGKPMMYWNWGILVGQGDIYIYSVKTSLYKTNPYAETTRVAMRYLHPVFTLMALAGLVMMIIPFRDCRNPSGSKGAALLLYSLLIYFTLVHAALAPLPRYAIPLRPFLFIAALFFLREILSFKRR